MAINNIYHEKLFSYGTLQSESVQLSTFGRKLHGISDVVTGYSLSELKIADLEVVKTSGTETHPILIYTGNKADEVIGMVFDISVEELHQADKYEVKEYKRVYVRLSSGINAWVYVSAK